MNSGLGSTGSLCWPDTGKAPVEQPQLGWRWAPVRCWCLLWRHKWWICRAVWCGTHFQKAEAAKGARDGLLTDRMEALERDKNSWGSLHKASVKWAPLMLWAKLLNCGANNIIPWISACKHKHTHTQNQQSGPSLESRIRSRNRSHASWANINSVHGNKALGEQSFKRAVCMSSCSRGVPSVGFLQGLHGEQFPLSPPPPPSCQSDFTLGFSTVAETQKVQGENGSRRQTLHLSQTPVASQRLDAASASVWVGGWSSAKFPVSEWREIR